MDACVFLTGATGFLGGKVVELLAKESISTYVLIRKGSSKKASTLRKKGVILIEGDMTKRNLGINSDVIRGIQSRVNTIIHCAALYDVRARRNDLKKNNVAGTRNIISFASTIAGLKTFNYASTLYVSGTYEGKFPEDKFPKVSFFHNYYEESKYLAEKLVRKSNIPFRIFRFPIIVGHSRTGRTEKFDGVYRLMEAIGKKKFYFYPGHCHGDVHVIPVDFAARFLLEAGLRPDKRKITFNMVEELPLKYREFIGEVIRLMGVPGPKVRIPHFLWQKFHTLFKFVTFGNVRSLQLFNQRIKYETKNYKRACKELGLSHQNLISYLPAIVEFYVRQNR